MVLVVLCLSWSLDLVPSRNPRARRAAVSMCAPPAPPPIPPPTKAEEQIAALTKCSPGINRQEAAIVDGLKDDLLNYCISRNTWPEEIVQLHLQTEFCAIPCKENAVLGTFLQNCLFAALRTTYPPPKKTFIVKYLDKQGQVLSEKRRVCPKPDSFTSLINDVYRDGLVDPAGNRIRDWEELQDNGTYTHSEDAPLAKRVAELEGRADNVVKKEEETLGGAVRDLLKPCPEFEDVVVMDSLRVLFAPSTSTAIVSKNILTVVEEASLYETANAMIHALLPQFTTCEKRFEFDAVIRARCANMGDVAILVEHKTTLDTEMLVNFTKKLEKLKEVSQKDGGQSMLSAFRGMQVFPIIYGRAPNNTQLSALQAEADKANILFLSPGPLPVVEFQSGSTHRERKRTCEEYQRFLRPLG